jgi:polyisoprenoid-binding protein YceI
VKSSSLRKILLITTLAVLPRLSYAAWEIEPSHTHVGFTVDHLGLTHTPGMFRTVSGKLEFDDKNIKAAKVTLNIATASIETANAARDAALRGEDWFDAQAYPQITFVSSSVKQVDAKHYLISGNLTVRGKTVPVDFHMEMTEQIVNPFLKVPALGFAAMAHVSRSAFGMTRFLPAVGDDVTLTIQLEMNKLP